MGRSELVVASLAVVLLAAPVARAQTAQDKASAEAAFEEGKRLMVAHAFSEACPKFAESLRRDPGIGTMLGLADCYEQNGQTASAWAEFREAAATAARKGDKREALARDNASRLEPLLSKLVVRVPPEADVRGLVVKRDGVELGRAVWGTEVPVDPGVHSVSASGAGWKEWQTTLDVPAHPGSRTITVPRLEAAAPLPGAALPTSSPHEGEGAKGAGKTQRIAGVAVAGVGVVAVIVGSVFGIDAKSKLDQSNANGHCDATDSCDAPGLNFRSEAKSSALASTVAFVLGGAAIAGGAVLWFTAPRDHAAPSGTGVAPSAAPRVGVVPAPGGVGLVGTF